MEGPSVLAPCPWQKRRAWARQSRGWSSPEPEGQREEEEEEEEEEQEEAAVPRGHPDHAVPEGSLSSKVHAWLQDCGAQRDRRLSPGDSAASSDPPSVPTGSSLSEVLAWWHSDAEDILHNLGFVGAEPGVAARIPPRFFSAPSRASGIDLGLFLRAQVRRLQTEDPCLLLASRFQQVQALAATADAFFCLYSYVSRTPLQRFAPYRDIPDSPELSRPGERLKRAVSSLCLHPGGGGDPGTPVGAARGPPERRCPHGRGAWGRWGASWEGDTRGDVTVGALPGRVGVTPQQPVGSRPRGDPGSGSWCHPGVPARAGGPPKPLAPRGAAESFELEEVPSEEEEGEDDEDDEDDEGRRLHPSASTRRSSLLLGRSHSSGFAEEPLPGRLT